MDKKTVRQLNEINQEFYRLSQEYFNRTRQYYWEGWEKIMEEIEPKEGKLKVLDVGCGNGRMGKFLKERLGKIDYIGMDNNEYLLEQAKKNVPKGRVIKQDVMKPWRLKEKDFDLVTMIGLLHHMPGKENRLELLKKAKRHLKPGGWLIVTIWQFNKMKRMARKIVPWEEFKKISGKEVEIKQLEKNDMIIDWKSGPRGFRFCHLIDKREIKEIVKELGMEKIKVFEADARRRKGNKYLILRKKR